MPSDNRDLNDIAIKKKKKTARVSRKRSARIIIAADRV